jgi:hypothetical protein
MLGVRPVQAVGRGCVTEPLAAQNDIKYGSVSRAEDARACALLFSFLLSTAALRIRWAELHINHANANSFHWLDPRGPRLSQAFFELVSKIISSIVISLVIGGVARRAWIAGRSSWPRAASSRS